MLQISKELFSQWNDLGLLYCHWKSNEHLNPGLDGLTDLDVLLAEKDRENGEAVLKTLCFLKCKAQYGSRYPGVDDWIGFDFVTGSLIHLHLHYRIITGHSGMKEYDLPWTERALTTRILDTRYPVYVMDPNLEIVTLYTRIGLKYSFKNFIKKLKGSYCFGDATQKEITYLKQRIDLDAVKSILFEYFEKEKAESVLKLMNLERLSAEDVLKLRKIMERNFAAARRNRKFVRFKEMWYFFVLRYRMKHRIDKDFIVRKVPFSEKGLVIAFVGQDGSGKTTVANDIIKWLSWKLDVRYYYLGSGENYQSWIKSALQITPNFGPFKIIRRSLFFLKYLKLSKDVKGLVCSAEDYSHKGGIAVFDRFPQTQHLGINDGPKLRSFCGLKVKNKKIISLLKPFFEREEKNIELAARHEPSIVFKLLLSPEESLHRKPENDINIITQKHNIIKSLKFEKSQVYEIDATLPYDKEIILIKNKIWEEIQK